MINKGFASKITVSGVTGPNSSPPTKDFAQASKFSKGCAQTSSLQGAREALTSHPPAHWHKTVRKVNSSDPLTPQIQLKLTTWLQSNGRAKGNDTHTLSLWTSPQRPAG